MRAGTSSLTRITLVDTDIESEDECQQIATTTSMSTKNVNERTHLLSNSKVRPKAKSSCYIPARYVLAFLSFTGFVNIFTLRMDMNIAILDLADDNDTTRTPANHHNDTTDSYHQYHYHTRADEANTNTSVNRPKLTTEQQTTVLGVFFYGYCSTQILGGWLTRVVGAKRVMGLSVLVTSVIALVTPVAAINSYILLLACRVAQGIAQGLAQPCMHTLWSKWAPQDEKSKLITVTFSGCQMGTIIATLVTGYICDISWEAIFYIYGSVGITWSVLWLLLVYESPSQHPRISLDELEYIQRSTKPLVVDSHRNSAKIPWLHVLTSPAFLAIVSAQLANDWGVFALTTCLPLYLKHIMKYNMKEDGVLSSLAFIALLFTNPISGFLADRISSRRILSIKNTRKLMNSIGLFIPSFLMVGVCFSDSSRWLTILLLTLAVGFTGFTLSGYTVNILDICPPFAGIFYGISNSIGTTAGFIGPVVLSVLTSKHNTIEQWRIFFIITAAVFFYGGLMFLLFARGEPLPCIRRYIEDSAIKHASFSGCHRNGHSFRHGINATHEVSGVSTSINDDHWPQPDSPSSDDIVGINERNR